MDTNFTIKTKSGIELNGILKKSDDIFNLIINFNDYKQINLENKNLHKYQEFTYSDLRFTASTLQLLKNEIIKYFEDNFSDEIEIIGLFDS